MARPFAWLTLLILSVGTLSSVLYMDSYLYRGVDFGPHSEPTPTFPGNGMGVNTFLDRETNLSDITRTLEMIKAAGFTWVRQEFPWEDIEPTPKGFQRVDPDGKPRSTWAKYDFIVSEADRLGLYLLIRLDRPPAWARQRGLATSKPGTTGPPDDFSTFGEFARTLADRYKGRPRYYQIWNEPNLHNEWNDQPIDPVGYVKLLAVAYRAIKEVDPQATVVMAGLAPTDQTGPENLNDLIFLEQAYAAGLAHYFDVMSVMIYGLGYPPEDRRTDLLRANFSRPVLIRALMEHFGDGSKPVIAAEYGWVSLPEGWAGRPSIWGDSISEDLQAQYLVDGYRRARIEWPWMSAMFVWAFKWPQTPSADPQDPTPYFAIVRPDYSPRKAYHALAEYAASQPRPNGRYVVNTSSLSFSTYATRVDLIIPDHQGPLTATWKTDGSVPRTVALVPGPNHLITGLPSGRHAVTLELSRSVTFELDLIHEPILPWGNSVSVLATMLLMMLPAYGVVGYLMAAGPSVRRFSRQLRQICLQPNSVVAPRLAKLDMMAQSRAGTVTGLVLTACLSAAVAGGVPGYLVAVLLGVYAITSFLWPPAGLAGVLATVGFVFRPVAGPVGSFAPSELLFLAWAVGSWIRLGVLSLADLSMSPWSKLLGVFKSALRHRSEIVLPAAFLAVATASLLVPPPYWLKYALREYRTVILEPIFLYFTVLALRPTLGNKRWPLIGLLGGGAVVAVLGIVQFFRGNDLVIAEGAARITSVYRHPNNLGLYLERIVPYGFALAMLLPRTGRGFVLALTSTCLAALLLTFSRGAWLATSAALIAGALLISKRRLAVVGAISSVVLIGVLAIFQAARLGDIWQLGSGSTSLRLLLWQAAINMIRDHPITGLGLDQFLYYYNPQYVLPGAWEERFTSHAHNLILDLWIRLGIIGLVVGALLIGALFQKGIATLRHVHGKDRWVLVGALSSSVAMLVHGMVDNAFFAQDLAYIFWFSYGAVMDAKAFSPVAAKLASGAHEQTRTMEVTQS